MQRRKDGKRSLDDLKRILTSFRIDELQTLLSYCGVNLYPRYRHKHELLARAKDLLVNEGNRRREIATSKILELYNQRYGMVAQSHESVVANAPSIAATFGHAQTYVPYSSSKDKDPAAYMDYHKQYAPPQQAPMRSSNAIAGSMTQSNVSNTRIYEQQPPRAVQPSSSITLPIHPDVKFMSLPFYDIIDILIKPTSLQPKTLSGPQDSNLVYHLTPYQTQLITNSRSYMNTIVEYAVQVQLRFCLNETSCVQEDLYPTRCKIVVNNKGIPLPGQPPPTAKNQEPRKPHRPINITSLCRLSPMQSNQIQLQWIPSDLGQRYAATVQLVKTVQPETLIQKLTNKPIRTEAHTIAFIKDKLSPDPDSEVAMTSLKVSLCCPIGRTRMKLPCRANKCKHLQCFDGSTYIQMNERKPSWVCPVCDQKAYYDDLFQDGLFTKIIADAGNYDDIVFFEDGSWRPLEDIQMGQEGARPLAESHPPKPSAPAQQVDIAKPSAAAASTGASTPVQNKNSAAATAPPTPSTTTQDVSPNQPTPITPHSSQQGCSEMYVAENSAKSSSEANNGGSEQQEPEEEIEVITIDDSDSDVDETNPTTSNTNDCQSRSATESNSGPSGPYSSNSDLCQPFDFYNIVAQSGEHAAPPQVYMDQNTMMGQLSSVTQQQQQQQQHQPPAVQNDVIDISD